MENMHEEQTEQYDEQIVLTKKNGVWLMDHYKNDEIILNEGKELVVALIDVQNPFAKRYVDGEILGQQYNSLYLKHNYDKDFEHHDCFKANDVKIEEVLKGEELVLALSKENMPQTKELIQYAKEHDIELPKSE